MDFQQGGIAIILVVCGGVCIIGFVPLMWFILVGRSGLFFNVLRSGFGFITGRDPEMRGRLRGERKRDLRDDEGRRASRTTRAGRLDREIRARRGRTSADSIRSRFDDSFEQRVGGVREDPEDFDDEMDYYFDEEELN